MTSIWNRIWPRELEVYANDLKAFPIPMGPFPNICANCGGHETMMVYVLLEGPFQSPRGKSKWLDLAPDPENPKRPSVPGWYNGELKYAPCPVCQQGRMEAWLIRNCGLSGDELYISLQDFRASGSQSGKAQSLAMAQSLLAQNHSPSGFVTYYGAFGTGKSHLLKGITNGFRSIGVRVKYTLLSDLLGEIRERFSDGHGSVNVEEAIEQYCSVPVLCLDEVADPDRVNMTGWAKETTFRLLDARHNDMGHVLTVLASNVSPDDMTLEWGYLRSRMESGEKILVGGSDMRPYHIPHRGPEQQMASSAQPDKPAPEYKTYNTASAINKVAEQHELAY
jgi:DNA replication protein DnaC